MTTVTCICTVCGDPFEAGKSSALYCVDCRYEQKSRQNLENRERRKHNLENGIVLGVDVERWYNRSTCALLAKCKHKECKRHEPPADSLTKEQVCE